MWLMHINSTITTEIQQSNQTKDTQYWNICDISLFVIYILYLKNTESSFFPFYLTLTAAWTSEERTTEAVLQKTCFLINFTKGLVCRYFLYMQSAISNYVKMYA